MSPEWREVVKLFHAYGYLMGRYVRLAPVVLVVMGLVIFGAAVAVDVLDLTGDQRDGLSLCCGFGGFAFLVWLVAFPSRPPPEA